MGEVRVRLLGPLEVDGLDRRDLGSRKARTLLKVLALGRGRPVSADRVIDALWPDGQDLPSRPAEQVGVLVSRLRGVLGADRLERSDAGWALRLDWLDVDELAARVADARSLLEGGSPGAARAVADAALALVRGELLAGEDDAVWAHAEQAAVARLVADASMVAAEAALLGGDALEAARLAAGVLDRDPYDERALRLEMRAHVAAGRPASALGAYATVRTRLAEDLGVDPAPETEALHTEILLAGPPARSATAAAATGTVGAAAAAGAIVGRDAELEAIDAAVARAMAGAAVGVVIEGEAGIGKTSLLAEARTRAAAAGAAVLHGRCDEMGRDLPLQPLLDGLASHLGHLGGAEAARVLGPEQGILGPVLAVPVAGVVGPVTELGDVAGRQALLFAALLAVIERIGDGGAVVIAIDDAHLAGPSTTAFLRFARARGRRLVFLAAQRPGTADVPADVAIRLGGLDLAAAARLVGDERAAALHARSDGHPLFLIELAATAGDELPSSIRAAVAARLDGLGGSVAATIRAAAVLGPDIDLDLLGGVLGVPVAAVLDDLETAQRERLVVEHAGALEFRHALIREALVADVLATRRAWLHRQAAQVLAGRRHPDDLAVAAHARLGGDLELASDRLARAAQASAARFDTDTALRLLDESVSLSDSAPSRLARARLRLSASDLEGAAADASAAVAGGGGVAALEVAGWIAYHRRDYAAAERFATEGVARADDPALRSSCLALSGRLAHAAGDLRAAEDALGEALRTAPAAARGMAQVWLAWVRRHQGRPDEAVELSVRARVLPEQLSHPFAYPHGELAEVVSLGCSGRLAAALAAADAALGAATSGDRRTDRFVPLLRNTRGWLLRNAGMVEAGAEENEAALTEGLADWRSGEPWFVAHLDLADGALAAGDDAAAAPHLDLLGSLDTWEGTMAWHQRHRLALLRARLLLLDGDAHGAAAAAAAVRDRATAMDAGRDAALAGAWAAIATARAGGAVDSRVIDGVVAALDRTAGLEAWWLVGELAAATASDGLERAADQRAAHVVGEAAAAGLDVGAPVRARLERISGRRR